MKKNRLTYLGVVFVLFMFIYLHDSAMTYTAFYSSIALIVVSFIMGRVLKRKIVATVELSSEFIEKNEEVECKVTIRNNGILPCFFANIAFEFENIGLMTNTNETYFGIKPYGEFITTATIKGKYRGVYDVGVKAIYIYDFLGLFKMKAKQQDIRKLIITPSVIKVMVNEAQITNDGEVITKRHIRGKDYSETTNLRQYQFTDSYKQIHWKATAKKNELISKEPQEVEQLASVFFVNNKRKGGTIEKILTREDKMMDILVSTMNEVHQLNHRISLHTLSVSHPELTTNLTKLYFEAAALEFGEFTEINQVLVNYLTTGSSFENVFVLTQEVDNEMVKILQEFKYLGSNISILLFDFVNENSIRRLQSSGINCLTFE